MGEPVPGSIIILYYPLSVPGITGIIIPGMNNTVVPVPVPTQTAASIFCF